MRELPKQKLFPRLVYFIEISSSSFFFCLFKYYYIGIFISFRHFFCALPYIHIQNLYRNNSGCLWVKFQCIWQLIIAHRIISNAQLFYWINLATNISSYIFEHLSFCKILCWWHLRCRRSGERICRGSVAGYSWWYRRCGWSSCWHCIEAISRTFIPVSIKVKVWTKKSILFSAQQIWRSSCLPGTDSLKIWNTFRWL